MLRPVQSNGRKSPYLHIELKFTSLTSFGGFKQKIKRTMRDRGGKSGSRDINCRTMVGSLGFEGSTDFGIDQSLEQEY